MRKVLIQFVPGLVAAGVGGVLGYFITSWFKYYNLYAPVIPGALAGLACGFCSLDHSKIRGVLCALISLSACVVTEWILFLPPVKTDGSLSEFVAHFHQQPPPTLLMIGLGTFLGFWWGQETTSPWRSRFSKTVDEV
jgi:hypothetical protein